MPDLLLGHPGGTKRAKGKDPHPPSKGPSQPTYNKDNTELEQRTSSLYQASTNLSTIPEPLRRTPQWMGTRLTYKPDGKIDKPPYRVRAGTRVKKEDKTNPDNWATFEDACAALQGGEVDAIGLVITSEDPYTLIDLDKAIDTNTGEIDKQASETVAEFPTYWEMSVSGTGLHGICTARKPGPRCKAGNVEMYDGSTGARFVVLTGLSRGLSSTAEIRECQTAVNALYARTFRAATATERESPYKPAIAHALSPEELLRRARSAASRPKFVRLYDQGDTSGYASHSDADFALINILIFWFAGNRDAIIEAFEASALYRPRQKHKGYVALSVDNALRDYKGSYYQPMAVRDAAAPEREDALAPYLTLLLDASAWRGQKAASAYKAYTALVSLAIERGIKANRSDALHIGVDVRTLAERAGLPRPTLCRSALPYLLAQKLIHWKRGKGSKAGVFVLPTPDVGDTTKEITPPGSLGTLVVSPSAATISVLRQLIRMRSGCSKPDTRAQIGEVTPARLGMLAMFCLVALTAAGGRDLALTELATLTGRRKSDLRRAMLKLDDAQIVVSSCSIRGRALTYRLSEDFLREYERSLVETGVTLSEDRQKRAHENERNERAETLRNLRRKRKVVNLADARAKPGQGSAGPIRGTVTPMIRKYREDRRKVHNREPLREEVLRAIMQEEYDEMVERCMERLEEHDSLRNPSQGGSYGG